jgi:hypothetical protein
MPPGELVQIILILQSNYRRYHFYLQFYELGVTLYDLNEETILIFLLVKVRRLSKAEHKFTHSGRL